MIIERIRKPVNLMAQNIARLDIENPLVYADFLAQTYYYVRHSTRLLAYGAGLMPQDEGKYFRRFLKHISEESNHEILAQKDLEELGYELADFPERPETKALWEPQYYKIMQVDPMVFMGYILALEQFACLHFPLLLEKVNAVYKGKALRFVKLHAEEDPDHVEKAILFIETLNTKRVENIMDNVSQTAMSYSQICMACNEVSQSLNIPSTSHIEKTLEARI